MARVFISCSRDEVDLVLRLQRALELAGIEAILPTAGIRLGANWNETLRGAIADSDAVVVLVSRGMASRNYDLFEVGLIWGSRKKTIPVILPGASYMDVPEPLLDVVSIPLKSENDIESVVARIRDALGLTKTAREAIGNVFCDVSEARM